jgi:hypothetical protein
MQHKEADLVIQRPEIVCVPYLLQLLQIGAGRSAQFHQHLLGLGFMTVDIFSSPPYRGASSQNTDYR